jgi:hypothetical protein
MTIPTTFLIHGTIFSRGEIHPALRGEATLNLGGARVPGKKKYLVLSSLF